MRGIALLMSIAGATFALVAGYHVDPTQTSWSGGTGNESPNNGVSEMVTCCWDSLVYVELFVGDSTSTGAEYRVGIWENGVELAHADGTQDQPVGWVRFENWNRQPAFTKGKEYDLRFTRSNQVSIQFYYQAKNPYRYGHMRVGRTDETDRDLCCRAYGRMNIVDSAWWGMIPWFPVTDPQDLSARQGSWLAREREAPIGIAHVGVYWDSIQPVAPNTYGFATLDTEVKYLHTAGIKIHARLQRCPKWASSRLEASGDTMSHYSAPCGLWAKGNGNYWALWLDTLVRRYDGLGYPIHTREIWNEPNDTLNIGSPSTTGWWRRPNTAYHELGSGARGLCSLYIRLVELAYDVIKEPGRGHKNDVIVMGGVAQVNAGYALVPGKDWLRTCHEVAHGNRHWDCVSVHPYQLWRSTISADTYETEAETLRAMLRSHGDYVPLWNTEMGWGTENGESLEQSRNVCEAFVLTIASEALPQGGYDRMLWHDYRGTSPNDAWGLMTYNLARRPSFYAYAQTASALTGMRFNGRVKDGDTAVDNHVRMYEFENPNTLERTWVCWKNGDTRQTVGVKLPVWTSNLAAESLAYTRTPPVFSPKVNDDGWLYLYLESRPVFISEKTAPQRPDLRVDSLRFMQASSAVRAWVTNHGTRTTPVRSATQAPYPTWAVLRANGDSLAQAVRTMRIAPNQQAEFTFNLSRAQLADTVLLSVTVNPNQTYVEPGTDDNTGYALIVEH